MCAKILFLWVKKTLSKTNPTITITNTITNFLQEFELQIMNQDVIQI